MQSFSSSFSGIINISLINSALAKAGTGTFTIDGATITGGEFHVLDGTVAQTSGNTNVTYLSVGSGSNPFTGNAPSVATLNVSGGTISFGSTVQVGDFGGVGTVQQSGGTVVLGDSSSPVSLNIGNQGGNGTYNLSGGALEFDGSGATSFIVIGRNGPSNSASAQQQSVGVLNLSGTGAMTVTDGSLFIGSNASATDPSVLPGSGTINQTGGTLTIDSDSRLFLAATGNGTYNLDGGTLQIGGTSSLFTQFNNSTGTYAFNLGGGTVQVIDSPLAGIANATLVAGTTSTIDTNGVGATWSGLLSGDGALAKAGAGTLSLTAINPYTGETDINAGTLALVGDGSLAQSSRIVANGTFDISAANAGPDIKSLAGSGVVNLGAQPLTLTAANDTFAGVFTGTGALTLDAGTETLTGGSTGFTGATTINGGSLWVNGTLGGAGSGPTTVNSGGLLGGGGSVAGDVTVANGGILEPGTGPSQPGTLTIGGNLALSSGSTLQYSLGQPNTTSGTLNDLLDVQGNLTLAGTLNVTETAGGTFEPGIYRIINYGGALTDLGLALGNVPVTGLEVETAVPQQVNLISPPADGSLVFWDGDAGPRNNSVIEGGSGTWQASAGNSNWTNSNGNFSMPFADGAFAVFTGAPGTVTIDNSLGAVTTSGMQFASNGYVLQGDTLTLLGSQALVRVGDGASDGAGITATITAPIAGSSELVKDDLGTLVLGGNNTYTGGTRFQGGTLQVANDGNLGDAAGALTLAGGTLENTASFSSARTVTIDASGTINNDAGTQLTLSGPIGGNGTLTKVGGGVLDVTGNGSFSGQALINAGALSIDGSLAGAGVTMASGTTLLGNGTIGATTLQAGSTIAPGHSIGTLNVQGNYLQNGGAVYQVQLDPASANADLITVSGAATLAPGAALQVSRIASTPYTLGTRYTVLDASGGLTGTFALSGDTAASAFTSLQGTYDADHAYLQVTQTRSLSDVACTRNPHATAGGLQSASAGNAALNAIVMGSQSDADACHALGQLSGEAYASVRTTFIDDSRFLREAVSDRMRGDSDPGSPAGNNTSGSGTSSDIWGHAFGSWAGYDAHGDTATVSRNIGGFFIGGDHELGAAWRLGVVGGYSHTDVDVDDLNSSGSSDDYHLGLYTGNDQGLLRFHAGVAYSWHDVSMTRRPTFNGYQATLNSDFDAATAQAWGELAYDMPGRDADLQPFFNAAYVSLRTNGFQEQGDAASALSGRGDHDSNTFSTLGARLSAPLGISDHSSLQVLVSAGWRHTYGQLSPAVLMQFDGGTPFGIVGTPLERDALAVDVSVGGKLAARVDTGISYSGLIGSHISDNGVKAYVRWQF